MAPFEFALVLFAVAATGGLIGSLIGLGGGFVLVPVLTLVFHVDIHLAIGTSIVAVVASSVAAAPPQLDGGISNLRVAIFLGMATTLGAFTGAWLSGSVGDRTLYTIFGVVLGLAALQMARSPKSSVRVPGAAAPLPPTGERRRLLVDGLHLSGSYQDGRSGLDVSYRAERPVVGLTLMYVAGTASGMLGIGSGALKVPAMDLAMRLPVKVSAATSNLLIGLTASAGAIVYLLRGQVDPYLAGPAVMGVLVGAFTGARVVPRLSASAVRRIFLAVVVVVAVEMVWKGLA